MPPPIYRPPTAIVYYYDLVVIVIVVMRQTRSSSLRHKKSATVGEEFVIELKSLRVPANMRLVTEMKTPDREPGAKEKTLWRNTMDKLQATPILSGQRYNLRARNSETKEKLF